MADPVVTITNGVPVTGTGTITTLGQTLLDGANATLGANADAVSLTGSISAKLRAIATALGQTALDLGISTGGTRTIRVAVDTAQLATLLTAQTTISAGAQQVVLPTDHAAIVVGGGVAHDGVDSGNPQKVGAKATNVEPPAVSASGDRANLISDMVGKLIVLPYANPENFVSGAITTAMTSTTTTSLIAAPAAGLRNYITQITVSNAHATVGTDVIIQDGSGGTTLYTIPAAAVYGGAVITFPTPLRQPTTATAIFCANVTTGASTKVSASGYKGA